jgi:hypothetical protein
MSKVTRYYAKIDNYYRTITTDMMEPTMIAFHSRFVNLGSKKLWGIYSPGSEGTYQCRFKPRTGSDISLPDQATNWL